MYTGQCHWPRNGQPEIGDPVHSLSIKTQTGKGLQKGSAT